MGMEFITTCCVVYFYYSHGELQTRGEKKPRVPVGIGNSHSIKFDMSALIIQVYAISNNDTLFSKYDWIGNYSFKTFILKGDILLCLISLCSRRGSNFYHIHNSATFNSGRNKSPEFRQSFLLRMQM